MHVSLAQHRQLHPRPLLLAVGVILENIFVAKNAILVKWVDSTVVQHKFVTSARLVLTAPVLVHLLVLTVPMGKQPFIEVPQDQMIAKIVKLFLIQTH